MQIAGYQVGEAWWNKAAKAGLAGGLAMAVYEGVGSLAMGHGFWRPLNLIGGAIPFFRPPAPGLTAQVALPTASGFGVPSPDIFWPGTAVGAALHLMFSMGWGLIYGLGLALLAAYFAPAAARSWFISLFAGLGFGVITYVVMGLLMGPALDPALNWIDAYPFFVAHVTFGLVTALTFTALVRQPHVSVTFAPEATSVERSTASRGSK